MKRTRKHQWLMPVLLLAALACAGSWAADQVRSKRDRSTVANMVGQKKTVCVGRFLIDIPAQAETSLSREMMAGFDIEKVKESETAFRERMAARESDIHFRGSAKDGIGGMVRASDLRIPGMTGRTFIYGRQRGYFMEGDRRVDDEWVSVESHAHIDGLSISLSAKYTDDARADAAEALLARLRLRNADEIPAVPGFCIGGAVFSDPLQPFMSLELQAGINRHPGGGPVDSSLHEDAVLALWDSVSSSIRLRNTGSTQFQADKSSGIRRFDYRAVFGHEAIRLLNHDSIAKLM